MEVAFKFADVADIDLLTEFMRELYEFDRSAFDEHVARSALLQILSDDSFGRVWLIQVNGSPVGYVVLTLGFSLEFHGRDAFIDELYIREQYRGCGVGRRAIELVEGACRSSGVRALHLEVEHANTGAQAVYRKLGFKDHERHLMTKWIGR